MSALVKRLKEEPHATYAPAVQPRRKRSYCSSRSPYLADRVGNGNSIEGSDDINNHIRQQTNTGPCDCQRRNNNNNNGSGNGKSDGCNGCRGGQGRRQSALDNHLRTAGEGTVRSVPSFLHPFIPSSLHPQTLCGSHVYESTQNTVEKSLSVLKRGTTRFPLLEDTFEHKLIYTWCATLLYLLHRRYHNNNTME